MILAKELEQMLKTTPVEKIHVSQLCRRSNVLPATFYYHFHDKYDLISWIFLNDIFQALPVEHLIFNKENMHSVYQKFTRRKWFYEQTFRDASQNALCYYMRHFIELITVDALSYANIQISNPTFITIKFYSYGITGLIYEWTKSSQSITEDIFITSCYLLIPESIQSVFKKYPVQRIHHIIKTSNV